MLISWLKSMTLICGRPPRSVAHGNLDRRLRPFARTADYEGRHGERVIPILLLTSSSQRAPRATTPHDRST